MQEKLAYKSPELSVTLFSAQADVITGSGTSLDNLTFEGYGDNDWF